MKNIKRVLMHGFLCLTLTATISGCSVTETLTPAGKGEKEYGKAETMIILTTEKLRCHKGQRSESIRQHYFFVSRSLFSSSMKVLMSLN